VSGSPHLPVVAHPAALDIGPAGLTERHLELVLERVPRIGLAAAASTVGLRTRVIRRVAERDPEVFGLRLQRALAKWAEREKVLAPHRPCACCGQPFQSAREHALHCSDRCRKASSRRRLREAAA
jgi:hypothetical protein